ncbi:histidine phosphatase family protein [Chromobacterium piscinae]|uniref:Histidine phosphatase family protein n=1 Tax=Chromobacterium piscinae TaxID=686831 RepID=A0ABV0H0P4_9NEIS|nr:histidine phosphatase family protein [Chromobacterium piscinae]MBX9297463.1 histidine phosphatase family protein [Chromobacterium vaccinii]MBX9357599.1 histidine phosphatase family protein [Chromobacterium vaccinii]MCD4506744.1 histidine phosphatase family protein [Chromobacterium piscinae]
MTQPVTRFCLVRHGETDWNREYRLQGHTDIPLNHAGLEQASQLAQAFRPDHAFQALYVSDLIRTRQTSAPLQTRLQLNAHYTPQLRERHMGALQGLTYAEAAEQIPDLYRLHQARDPDFDLEGGESLRRFRARILDGLASIAALHPGENVLIVTHGGVLDIIYRAATSKPLEEKRDFPIPNAALNWLDYQDGGWTLRRWADESHLSSALDEIQ